MNSKSKITGLYTSLAYIIKLNEKVIYQAGNSPSESQVYLLPGQGVGLATMRKFCEQTAKELAEEHEAEFVSVKQSAAALSLREECIRSTKLKKPQYAFVPLW